MSENGAIILQTSSVKFENENCPNLSYKAEVTSSSIGLFPLDDKEGRKLAEEFAQKPISIQIDLLAKQACRPPDLRLYLKSGETNLLQQLRDWFQDDVTVSVKLQAKRDGMEDFLLRAERMTINPITHTCDSGEPKFSYSLSAAHVAQLNRWELSIKIHIPSGGTDVKVPCPSSGDDPHTSLSILEEELHSDVMIHAADRAKVTAHKCFLSAASPVLWAAFNSKMKESFSGTLDMPDMSEKAVKAFLRYAYAKDLTAPSEDTEIAFDLLRAAHKYQMPTLETLMVAQVEMASEDDFGVAVAFKLYAFVKAWDPLSKLKAKAIRIIKAKWEEFGASEEYDKLFQDGRNDFADEFFKDIVNLN